MKFINLVQTLTPKLTKRISRMYRYNVENSSEEANFAKVYNLWLVIANRVPWSKVKTYWNLFF